MSGPLFKLEFEALAWVTVKLPNAEEDVLVDAERGPMVYQLDGKVGLMLQGWKAWGGGKDFNGFFRPHSSQPTKKWLDMTATEQEIHLTHAAKKNKSLADWKGRDFFRLPDGAPVRGAPPVAVEQEPEEPQKTPEELEAEERERKVARCAYEAARPPVWWNRIEVETVTQNHAKKAKGMIYGIEFPWTADMLEKMGPEWLTQAFHVAGTMPEENKVTKITIDKKSKITTGNNAGKFFFSVKYKKPTQGLHTELFAKIPHPMEKETRSDRLSSSVNKQPSELYEINTYRLLEASLGVKTPKFYFGDISNETSNWIIITEKIAFTDRDKQNFGEPQERKKPIAPWVLEGPYDKCMDHNLRGNPLDYYTLLVRTGAKIAGLYKAGALADRGLLDASFANEAGKGPEYFGFLVQGPSGEDPRVFKPKLEGAMTFISDTGSVLFPSYVKEERFLEVFRATMFILNSYAGELRYWKHSNDDYIALTHPNMNVDNAYFWRDTKGKLQLGVFDWGGLTASSLGHKLWWWIYCADYPLLSEHFDTLVEAFVDAYASSGGPMLDAALLKSQVVISALEQMVSLCMAVPQIVKMCPKKEWPTIKSRYDPRIGENIDGKSTLRLYLHVMNTVIRLMEEKGGVQELEDWLSEVYEKGYNLPRKPKDLIEGLMRVGSGL